MTSPEPGDLLRRMLLIRGFEERVGELSKRQELPGFVHLSIGQEAVAVGICSALEPNDRLTSTHRGHGHALAKGSEPAPIFAELMGLASGYCRGKGGSMHLVDLGNGVLGANGIVGAGMPIAVGSALQAQFASDPAVTVAFFGDGASNEGVFLESMNMAAIWRLPLVFVCENNGFAEWTPAEALTAGQIADRGPPFGIESVQVEGNDLLAVREAAFEAVVRARSGNGPTLIEAITYRTHGHLVGEEALTKAYRSDEEVEAWKDADPITLYADRLIGEGRFGPGDVDRLRAEVDEELTDALEVARTGAPPDPSEALTDVYRETG